MYVHFRILKTGGGLNDGLDRRLNVFGYIDDIIPVPDGDDGIDYDLLPFKVDLDPLGQGLQTDQFGKLCPCSRGHAGNPFHIQNRSADYARDDILRDVDTAVFFPVADIAVANKLFLQTRILNILPRKAKKRKPHCTFFRNPRQSLCSFIERFQKI